AHSKTVANSMHLAAKDESVIRNVLLHIALQDSSTRSEGEPAGGDGQRRNGQRGGREHSRYRRICRWDGGSGGNHPLNNRKHVREAVAMLRVERDVEGGLRVLGEQVDGLGALLRHLQRPLARLLVSAHGLHHGGGPIFFSDSRTASFSSACCSASISSMGALRLPVPGKFSRCIS